MVHPIRNVLNKMRWDKRENAEKYIIAYRHRGAPDDVKKVHASNIVKLGKSYFTLSDGPGSEEAVIPFHRIIEIRNLQEDKVIWRSRKARS